MSRSIWKSEISLNHLVDFELSVKKKIAITTYCRASLILPYLIGNNLHVHNGKKYVSILITDAMLSHKLGEFAVTRGSFVFKKKGKRVRKKKGQ